MEFGELISVLREDLVVKLSEEPQLGLKFDGFGNRDLHRVPHNVALATVRLLVPFLLDGVLKDAATVLEQQDALVSILELLNDPFPKVLVKGKHTYLG